MSSSQVIVQNKSVLRSIAGTTGNPPSARALIALSLLITALCALFAYDLNYDLIFSKRGWFNF